MLAALYRILILFQKFTDTALANLLYKKKVSFVASNTSAEVTK